VEKVSASKKLIFVLVIASIVHGASAGTISEVTEKMLARTPEAAFEDAVAKNDLRVLTIPFCDEVAPGFDFRAYKGKELQNNDLGMTCRSVLGEDELKALLRLEAWVGKYNSLVFDKLKDAE
jgi:hypothetical protein